MTLLHQITLIFFLGVSVPWTKAQIEGMKYRIHNGPLPTLQLLDIIYTKSSIGCIAACIEKNECNFLDVSASGALYGHQCMLFEQNPSGGSHVCIGRCLSLQGYIPTTTEEPTTTAEITTQPPTTTAEITTEPPTTTVEVTTEPIVTTEEQFPTPPSATLPVTCNSKILVDLGTSGVDFLASSLYDNTWIASQVVWTTSKCWSTGDVRNGWTFSPGIDWIRIDFGTQRYVKAVETKGYSTWGQSQWVTSYKIQTSDDDVQWATFKDSGGDLIFTGTTSGTGVLKNPFPYPVYTRYIRLVIWSFGMGGFVPCQCTCLNLEYYGC